MTIKTFTVVEPITLSQGKVKLSKKQAARHAPFLKKSGQLFEILAPIMFKAGESFGYDGELPRAVLVNLDEGGEIKSEDQGSGQGGSAPAQNPPANSQGNQDQAQREALENRKKEIDQRLGAIDAEILIATEAEEIQALEDEEKSLKAELSDIETKLNPSS